MKKTVCILSVLLLTAMAVFMTSCNSKKEKGQSAKAGDETVKDSKDFLGDLKDEFVEIPGKDFFMLKTEVTQKLYKSVMGYNPSSYEYEDETNPVENVSWYDAIYFCNKLSEKNGLEPVYKVDGVTDVAEWGYKPGFDNIIEGIIKNDSANGFRLPTLEEWEYAARGGQDFIYAGSDDLDEVGWYDDYTGYMLLPVAQKKANGYGLYDMSGNVSEWCWDVDWSNPYYRYYRGGSFKSSSYECEIEYWSSINAHFHFDDMGFRIVCSASN